MLRDTEWANPCRNSIARSQCDERGSRLSRPCAQSGIATNALKGNLSHDTGFFSTTSKLENRDRVAGSLSEALKTVEVEVLGRSRRILPTLHVAGLTQLGRNVRQGS